MTELSRGVATPGGYAAAQERGCSGLLAALEKDDTPLVCLGHRAGHEVYRGDDVGRTLYVITGGVVKLFASYPAYVGGKDATFLLLGPGDIFGFPLFAGRRTGRVSAEVFADCEVVKIPGAFLERTVRRRPEVALDVATLLERRLVEYEELVGCLLPRRTEVRLARVLPILARKFGERTGEGSIAIGLRLTRTDLAQMTAATRESVTAAVIRLHRERILVMEAGRIVLLDPKRLAEIGRQ